MFRHWKQRRAERLRQEEEAREERARKQREAEERKLENLRKWHFIVQVRERDGRKTFLESSLVDVLVRMGVTVLGESDGSALGSNELLLKATAWVEQAPRGGYETDSGRIPPFQVPVAHYDYRLSKQGESGLEVAAAGYLKDQNFEWVTHAIARHLLEVVSELDPPPSS